jgi:pilus assembly protein CpaE
LSVYLAQGAGGSGRTAFFLPAQGGNGASTAAIHFAASIAAELRDEKAPNAVSVSPVLLLDLDFHSDSAAFWLNKRPAYTLTDALDSATPAASYWRKITTRWNGVDLLAPPPPDSYVSEELLAALPNVLLAAASAYSWVVVDLPPTLFSSSRRLLPRGELVFLVCTPEARSLYLARRRLSDLKALGVRDSSVRVTLNRAGAKRAIEAATAEKSIGVKVSFSIDNDYLEISSAYSDRRLASPSSAPGKQFRNMARVALGVCEAASEKSSGWRRLVGIG